MPEKSLLAHLYVRPHLFRTREVVYLRDPNQETDAAFASALRSVIKQLGSNGPFAVLRIRDTPDSRAAPQKILFSEPGSEEPVRDEDGPLWMTGYAFESRS